MRPYFDKSLQKYACTFFGPFEKLGSHTTYEANVYFAIKLLSVTTAKLYHKLTKIKTPEIQRFLEFFRAVSHARSEIDSSTLLTSALLVIHTLRLRSVDQHVVATGKRLHQRW